MANSMVLILLSLLTLQILPACEKAAAQPRNNFCLSKDDFLHPETGFGVCEEQGSGGRRMRQVLHSGFAEE